MLVNRVCISANNRYCINHISNLYRVDRAVGIISKVVLQALRVEKLVTSKKCLNGLYSILIFWLRIDNLFKVRGEMNCPFAITEIVSFIAARCIKTFIIKRSPTRCIASLFQLKHFALSTRYISNKTMTIRFNCFLPIVIS